MLLEISENHFYFLFKSFEYEINHIRKKNAIIYVSYQNLP